LGFYQSRKWIDGITRAYNLTRYSVSSGDQRLFVFDINSFIFGHRLIATPFCEYGVDSIATLSDPVLENLKTLKEITGAVYIEVRSAEQHKALQVNGEFSTFSISGESIDQIWWRLDKKLRNQIKRTTGRFSIVDMKYDLDQFYSFYILHQTRRGSPIHSRKFFELSGLQVYAAILEPTMQIASAVIIGQDGSSLNWWGNINDPKLRNLNGTSALLWHVILEKFKPGFSFDLGRTRPGPIRNYKKQWGGVEKPIYTLTDIPAKKVDPNERGPELASKVWRYLPLGVASLLGPQMIKEIAL
jgi:hypothetical protein